MRAINHSLTGAIIGLTVAEPLLAAPLAFISHYLLDMIPHYGGGKGAEEIRTRTFQFFLIADFILCFILVLVIFLVRPVRWPMAIVCAFLAASPDFGSINCYIKHLRKLPWKPGKYTRFAIKIQWFERPIGLFVEAVWMVGVLVCLSVFLNPKF